MTIIESGSDRLVVQAGSLFSKTTLTLDKKAGRASVENSILMWRGRPHEIAIADIAGVDLGVPSGEADAVQTMRGDLLPQRLRDWTSRDLFVTLGHPLHHPCG